MDNHPKKKIVVTGATGSQGGAAARHLLARGFAVSAFTRHPEKAAAHLLARKGAEVFQGNLDDPQSVATALRGAYGVFVVLDFWTQGYDKEIQQGITLIDAAKAARVRHFVYSSVASADADTGLPHFESKRRIERLLQGSGLEYNVLRPVFFMDNFSANREDILEGHFKSALPAARKLQMIAVDDIGRFAAEVFERPQAFPRILEIAGAELTMPQAAEVFSETLGRPVQFEEVPLDMLAARNPEAGAMYAWFRDKGYTVDVQGMRARFPWLKTFGEWARAAGWETESERGAAPHGPISHSQSPTVTG